MTPACVLAATGALVGGVAGPLAVGYLYDRHREAPGGATD